MSSVTNLAYDTLPSQCSGQSKFNHYPRTSRWEDRAIMVLGASIGLVTGTAIGLLPFGPFGALLGAVTGIGLGILIGNSANPRVDSQSFSGEVATQQTPARNVSQEQVLLPEVLLHPEKEISLEDQFKDFVLISVNTEVNVFLDFLEPNENPLNIEPHLKIMKSGWIVSTGTERSFFDLILSPDETCSGLVIRDINPKVKAYTDFLILLFRISESREEFVELSEKKENTLCIIKEKIIKSLLSDEMKEYYIKNLNTFANVYFGVHHIVGEKNPNPVDYWQDDKLFAKIKRYADQGKIISTIGDIGDLEFLGDSVSVVDTSNIQNYSVLDIRTSDGCNPRVIWSNYRTGSDPFYSYIQNKLTNEERKDYNSILSKCCGENHNLAHNRVHALFYLHHVISSFGLAPSLDTLRQNPFAYPTPASYTKESLNFLRAASNGIFVDRRRKIDWEI